MWGYVKQAIINACAFVCSMFFGYVFKPVNSLLEIFQQAVGNVNLAVDFSAYVEYLEYAQPFVDLNYGFGVINAVGTFFGAVWMFRFAKSFLPTIAG